MNALQKKLRIKEEQKVLLISPPDGYWELLGEGLTDMDFIGGFE